MLFNIVTILTIAIICCSVDALLDQPNKPNLLFIMPDDLRPELSVYGRKHAHTPNFERLARRSVVFDRTYNQVPVCFPSRHSLLTGIRPDTTSIITWTDRQMPYLDGLTSILVRNKYHSSGFGKLFHHPRNGSAEYPDGRWDGQWYKYQNNELMYLNSSTTPDSTRREEWFRDHEIATRAIDSMRAMSAASDSDGRPWSVSVGFKQPHTQYHVPRKYFNLYKNSRFLQEMKRSDDKEWTFPSGAPRMNYRCCALSLVRYMQDEGRVFSNATTPPLYGMMTLPARARAELMWGYLAGVSFLDAQVGRLLDALDALPNGNGKNTVIVFKADHGMHLGEKGMWEKYTLFEETSRVPFLISYPHHPQRWSAHYPFPVESVDILPTTLAALGITRNPVLCPRSRLCFEFEGVSLLPWISGVTPTNQRVPSHQGYAITQMRRCLYRKREQGRSVDIDDKWSAICGSDNKPKGSVMGYSIRTDKFRYTAWIPYSSELKRVDYDAVFLSEELYSHVNAMVQDFTNRESVNIANFPPLDTKAQEALQQHRNILLNYLRKKAWFTLDDAADATKVKYQAQGFKLSKDGRAVGVPLERPYRPPVMQQRRDNQ